MSLADALGIAPSISPTDAAATSAPRASFFPNMIPPVTSFDGAPQVAARGQR
jgi:hypothetical protein